MAKKPTYEELEKRINDLMVDNNRIAKMEAELNRSLKFTESLLSVIPTPIFFQDAKGRYQGCNPAFTEIMGMVDQDLYGKKVQELWPSEHAEVYHQKDLELMQHPKRQIYEFEVKDKDGTIRPVVFYKNVFYDENDKVAGLVGGFVDITAHKLTETTLKKSEKKYRQLFEKSSDAIFVVDKSTGRYLDANAAAEELTGFPVSDLKNLTTNELTPIGAKQRLKALEVSGGRPKFEDVIYIRKDGSKRVTRLSIVPLDDETVYGIVHDVTERKKAEKALRDSELKFRNIINSSPMGIHMYELKEDDSLVFIGANPASDRILGIDHMQFMGKTIEEAFHGLVDTEIPARYRDVAKHGRVWRAEQINYNEGEISGIFEVIAFQIEPGKMAAFFNDITERRQAKDALRESEQKYKSLANNLNVGIYRNSVGSKGKFIEANPAIVKMFGFESKEDFLKVRVSDLYKNPDDRTTYNAKLLKNGEVKNEELQLKKKDGTTFVGSVSAVVVKNEKDKDSYFDGIIEDISERKRTEEDLRKSEEKYRHLFETAMIGIYRTRIEDGKFLAANQKMATMLGYDSVDKLVEEYVTSAHYTDPTLRKKLLDELQSQGRVDGFEIEMMRIDGSTIQIALSAIAYPEQGYLEGFIVDITKRKEAEAALRDSEEKLVRSKKMESLGLLAGGVAHDLNNVLSGIVSYPDLILLDLPEDSKFRKPIETIKESGHRAVAIVQDLLTVARGVAITREPLNLNGLIGDYLHSPEFNKLKRFHPMVTVKTKLTNDLLNISASPVHIRKMLMNLVSNAAEAAEGGGSIIISTMNRYVDRPLSGYDNVNIGEYVVLSVADDGPGISSDDLERIFEPFYSKKFMGRSGTGLGLAVVWNIVLDHKGYIDVLPDKHGTTFEVYLPITRDDVFSKRLPIRIDDFKGDGETILVVDDIETQREISCKMLDTLGYKTKAVSSGEEAIKYLKRNAVDCLLLDMIMDPGINGRETYEKIIEIHPNQKAIIVSGFAYTDDVRETQKLGAGQFIKKPITLEKIGIAIKEELGRQ